MLARVWFLVASSLLGQLARRDARRTGTIQAEVWRLQRPRARGRARARARIEAGARGARSRDSQDGVVQLLVALGSRFPAGFLHFPGAGASRPARSPAAGDLAWDGWVKEGVRRESKRFGEPFPRQAWGRVCKVQVWRARTVVTQHRTGSTF